VEADFELRAGEVHALVGEKGAGKSTLSRIVAGITTPDSGDMFLRGQPYGPASRRDAERLGVRMVMQELNLIATLTVAESIFIDRLPQRFGWIDRRRLNSEARAVLEQVGLGTLDPETPVGTLGIARQQLVEIAAGLSARCDVLILDEPTAALTEVEIELLFEQITRLKAAGAAIIYISHRHEEISRIADRVTVLRDGRVVATERAAKLPKAETIRLMVGRDLAETKFRRPAQRREPALRVEHLSAGKAVREVSFELFRGEILGFAGLMGAGRTETMRAIFGADPIDGGALYLNGESAPAGIRSPREAVARGIALLTEDRKGEGLLLPWPVRQNVTLPSLDRVRRAGGWIAADAERTESAALAGRLRIRCASVEQPVRELSGGNQQKVVIAKWLYRDCDILIFDEPTRGIDVGAKFEIYQLLTDLAAGGKAVMVVSSELLELFAICHRIAVLSAGRLVRIFEESEFEHDAIMRAALGEMGGNPKSEIRGPKEIRNPNS